MIELNGLHDGTIDLGMTRPSAYDEELEFRRLPPERLVVALPRSWNLPLTAPKAADGDMLPSIDLAAPHGRDVRHILERRGPLLRSNCRPPQFNLIRTSRRDTRSE